MSGSSTPISQHAEAEHPALRIEHDASGRLTSVSGVLEHSAGRSFPSDNGLSNGAFVRWSAGTDVVEVELDALGLMPLFVCRGPTSTLVSTSIASLLRAGAPSDLDARSISAFCKMGYPAGLDTPFRSISAAPPGWKLVIDREGTTESRSSFDIPESRLDEESLLVELAARFRTAVARRVHPEMNLVTLSGGKDSRHVLFELASQNAPGLCSLTIARSARTGTDDASIAAILSRDTGAEHTIVPAAPQTPRAEFTKDIRTNFIALDHAWAIQLGQAVAHAPAVWDGLAGDVLLAGLYFDDKQLDAARQGDVSRWYAAMHGRATPVDSLATIGLGSIVPGVSETLAKQRVEEELASHLTRHNPVTSYYFWNRTRRCVAGSPLCLFGDPARVLMPFTDTDFWELAFALPASLQSDHRFHKRLIARTYPEWSKTPYAGSGRSRKDRILMLPKALRHIGRVATAPGFSTAERFAFVCSVASDPNPRRLVLFPSEIGRARSWSRALRAVSNTGG